MIQLGDRARDKVTQFEGVVTARAEYLYGCNQFCLVPSVDKDGKLRQGEWFDEGRLVVFATRVVPPESVQVETKGGPQPDAPPVR